MKPSVLAELAALKAAPVSQLKTRWRELFDSEPPAYNRRNLESRLAYRVQELAFGGLSRDAVRRLEALAGELAAGGSNRSRRPPADRPITGTRLVREWQGVEHCVTVRAQDFEYEGRPYKSL